MLYRFETEYGTISITRAVVVRIIQEAVGKFHGKVYISNAKGKVITGFISRIGYFDDSANIEITMGSQGLDVRIFIVIRFGTSIGMVTSQLIEEIQSNITNFTGLKPNSVAIVVAGTLSQHLKRRNIEFIKENPL